MTFNEPAFMYLFIYILIEVFVAFQAGWMTTELKILLGDQNLKISSMTRDALKNEHSIKPVFEYLNKNARDERKAKKLYVFYYISFVPALIGVLLSIVGLFTTALNDILSKYYFILFIFIMVLVLSPACYRRD